MELKDLKNGMVVKDRKGDYFIVINEYLISHNRYDLLNNLNSDLTSEYGEKFDIVEIYKERKSYKLIPNFWFEGIKNEVPIWKREDEVDWTKIPKWTKVQVRDDEEEEWKNAYFLSFDKKSSEFQFEISFNDEFISEDVLISRVYNQCRLYKED